MAVSPILVNAGSMSNMGNQNSAFSLMGKALNDMEARSNTRKDRANAASQALLKRSGEAATRDIIGATQKNTVLDDFQNRFDAEYSSIFDENGVARKGQEAKAAKWSDGGFGESMDQTEQDNLMRLERGVDDAGRFSGDVYDRMLRAGLSPDQAEAQRKTQLAKWTPAAMSKQALQDRKIQMEGINKRSDTRTKLLADMYHTSESSSAGSNSGTGGKSAGSRNAKGYAGDQNAFSTKFNMNEDIIQLGGGLGSKKAYDVYSEAATRYNSQDLNAAISRLLKQETIVGKENEARFSSKADFAKQLEKELAGSGSKSVAGGTGYGQNSRSGTTAKDRKALLQSLDVVEQERLRDMNNVRLAGNKPGEKAVMNSIFDWYDEPKKEAAPVVKKKKKTPKTKKKVLETPKPVEEETLPGKDVLKKSGGEKTKENPLGLGDNDVDSINFEANRDPNAPTDVYKPRPKLLDDPLGWASSFNMTPKGEGRDTFKTSDTKGGNFKLNKNIVTEKDLLNKAKVDRVSKEAKQGQVRAKAALKKQFPNLTNAQIEEKLRQANIMNPGGLILQ